MKNETTTRPATVSSQVSSQVSRPAMAALRAATQGGMATEMAVDEAVFVWRYATRNNPTSPRTPAQTALHAAAALRLAQLAEEGDDGVPLVENTTSSAVGGWWVVGYNAWEKALAAIEDGCERRRLGPGSGRQQAADRGGSLLRLAKAAEAAYNATVTQPPALSKSELRELAWELTTPADVHVGEAVGWWAVEIGGVRWRSERQYVRMMTGLDLHPEVQIESTDPITVSVGYRSEARQWVNERWEVCETTRREATSDEVLQLWRHRQEA